METYKFVKFVSEIDYKIQYPVSGNISIFYMESGKILFKLIKYENVFKNYCIIMFNMV